MKNDEGLQSEIDVFKQEVEYYKNLDNPDWSLDKNEWFKQGLSYCLELLKRMDKDTKEYYNDTL